MNGSFCANAELQNNKNIEAVTKKFSEKKNIDEIIRKSTNCIPPNTATIFFLEMTCKAKQITGFYIKRKQNKRLVSI